MFPTEDSLYLLTDAAMALKVDPETLDTTDEVRTKHFQKVSESSQKGKPRNNYRKTMAKMPEFSKKCQFFPRDGLES